MQQDLYYEYYNLDLEKLDLNPLTWLNMKGNNPTFRKNGSTYTRSHKFFK